MKAKDRHLIDKLDVRVPAGTPFTPSFAALFKDHGRMRPEKFYQGVGDFREYNHGIVLHTDQRRTGSHKLEVLDAGLLGFSQIKSEIESVFDVDSEKLEIMRVDLAADIKNVPVGWFRTNSRVAHKRGSRDIGVVKYDHQRGSVETLYFGMRPNLVRIYDRTALLREKYAVQHKHGVPGALTFDEMYGHSPDAVLTRVERQYGNRRGVPEDAKTVEKLRLNAVDIEPFSSLRLEPGGSPAPDAGDYGSAEYLKGMGIRQLTADFGLADARKKLNRQGNADRLLKQYREFLPASPGGFQLPDLQSGYRASVLQQLAA